MLRTEDMTTVWGEMELAAPTNIEEDTTPPAGPSKLIGLFYQNLILIVLVRI